MSDPDALRSLLDGIVEVAHALGDRSLIRLAESAREHAAAPRLQVAVAGLTGSGRAAVTNALLASPGVVPVAAIPKPPIDIGLRFGPSPSAELSRSYGREAVPMGRLRSALLGADATSIARVDIQAPAELLKTCDLTVVALDSRRGPEGWTQLLGATDFLVLVLRAPALLSLTERSFIRDHLVPFGLQRVAIVVNQIDLVEEEERTELESRVRDFLGPYESQPVILQLQATGATARESGFSDLATLAADLAERHPGMRQVALMATARNLLSLIEEGVEREARLAALGSDEIDRVRAALDSRREWLHGRAERTQAEVRASTTLTKEKLLRAIDGFAEMIRRRLPEEIVQVEELGPIKQHLPGYLETIWSDFLQRQMLAARSALLDEAQALAARVEQDLEELLGEHPALLPAAVLDLDVDPLPTFVTPRRGKHRAESIIRALSMYGYFMLLFNPTSGVLALGIGQLVRKVFGGEIALSDKRAIAQAALNAMRTMESDLKAQIERDFGQITADLQAEVARAYEEGMEQVDSFLAGVAARQRDGEGTTERLERLQRERLPELQQALDVLGSAPAGAEPVSSGGSR